MPRVRPTRALAGALALCLARAPSAAAQQQPPAARDSLHQHGDTLTRPPLQLQEITVSAQRVRREEPASAVTLTPVTLQRTPALNPYDLLRQAAGLEVHDQGQGPGFAANASMRGFTSDHSTDVALWIDGVPINEPVNGHAEGYNDWNVLFPQAVRDVDVLRGPTSALYGNFALAGTVNVRTLERMTGTRAWATAGLHERAEGTLLTGFDRPGAGGVFGVRVQHDGGWRPNGQWTLGQVHGRVVKDLSSSTALDAGVELYGSDWRSPGFLTLDEFDRRAYDVVANPTDRGYKLRGQERVSLRVVGGPNLLWRSTLYATQGRWQLFLTTPPEGGATEGSGSQLEEEDRRLGLGATSALTWAVARTSVTVGFEGRWDRSHYENWYTTNRVRDSANVLVRARQLAGALFVQATTDVGHHLRLAAGGRGEVQDTRTTPEGGSTAGASKGVFAPKLGALYHVHRLVDLYANVSRGYRRTDGVIEDPALPFITAWAYEAGIKLDARGVNASAAAFRTDVSDEQTFDPVTLTSTSGGRSRRQGVELEARARLSGWVHAGGSVTFTDAKYRALVTAEGDTLTGARVFNTAKYVGSGYVEVAPPDAPWHVRVATNVVGPYAPFDEPGTEVGGYALVHASAGIQFGQALLDVGLRNLLDRAYPELRAGGFVVPGQSRMLFATVQYFF